MPNTMSQKTAREGLSNPELFEGGVYVTKNGVAELFIQTAAERQLEEAERLRERQSNALLKLVMKAKHEVTEGKTVSPEAALQRLRTARK